MNPITENIIEHTALELLKLNGWNYIAGKDLSPENNNSERATFQDVILEKRLVNAAVRINPGIPYAVIEQAVSKVKNIYSPDLIFNNETFHRLMVEKVKVPYHKDGFERSHEVTLIDFDNIGNNEFIAVNQFTVIENNRIKRPDIVLFINGLPLVVIELKNATDTNATLRSAYEQVQTYKFTIPSLFTYNSFCVISDGTACKSGSISAGYNRYSTWKTADGKLEATRSKPEIETTIKGMLNHKTLLDLIRNFIVFEKTIVESADDKKSGIKSVQTVKKLAAYHQYYAVNKAIEKTVEASGNNGDRRGGVVWHTQGSGKSLSMVFYSGKLIIRPEMKNPTIVVLTDRNDLDDQLFGTFSASKQLLRQEPVQAQSRENLKELLNVASGGIVFTTIQKFSPDFGQNVIETLSERENIVVVADEAHRSQYGFDAKIREENNPNTKAVVGKRIAYGFAKYMREALPKATFIGFTGTPIESKDINTPQVFGNYIDIYDIAQAVRDGATVPIYYESRLAKVSLDEKGRKLIEEFDEQLEMDEEISDNQRAKAKWTKLEAIVGSSKRLNNLSNDIIQHFEQRQEVFAGKGMIVAMSRRIAVDLYNQIVAKRPEWHDDDLGKGKIKVVMTSASSDGAEFAKHHTVKSQRRLLSDRLKDENNLLQIVIVIDMWLTGFDVPCLTTMYIDKPMRGHSLMQAIARVNRVYKDKKGGLIVDYLGIASDLKKALAFYSESKGQGEPTENIELAVSIMLEKYEIVKQMFNEKSNRDIKDMIDDRQLYDTTGIVLLYKKFFDADSGNKLKVMLSATDHILGLDDGKNRFVKETAYLCQSFALAVPHDKAMKIKDDVALFQGIRAILIKSDTNVGGGKTDYEVETAVKNIIDKALSSETVIDIFSEVGLQKPEITILSEEFLIEVKNMKHKNLAFEVLKKILNDEIKNRTRVNLIQSKKLLEMLESAIKRYQNNLITTTQVIQELIELAEEIRQSDSEAKRLGLTEAEYAFYTALEVNDSAVKVLGDEHLRLIAREIAEKVRANTTIDWTIRESARANLMSIVKRTLKKLGYPPDKTQKAIDTVIEQAELMANYLVEN